MMSGVIILDHGYQLLISRKDTAAALDFGIEFPHFTSYSRQSLRCGSGRLNAGHRGSRETIADIHWVT